MNNVESPITDLATLTSMVPAQQSIEAFNELVNSGGFFPRLQLMTSNTELAKEGKVRVNSYAIIDGKNYTELGPETVVVPLHWRPFALSTKENPIVSSHDQKSELFKKIEKLSSVKNSGAMCGPEFLVWVPDAEKFATLFFGSVSARRVGKTFVLQMNKPTLLKSEMVQTTDFKWYIIKHEDYTPGIDKFPSASELQSTIEKFINPPVATVEVANEPATDR